MPGESEPPAVVFLRSIVACEHAGLMFRYDYRREAAAALSYWERRCKKVELQYSVPDEAERRTSWRRILNGALRIHLGKHGRWPADKRVLFSAVDEFELPACDLDLALSALLSGGNRQQSRRRRKAIDERVAAQWSGSEAERKKLLLPLAQLVHARLKEFGLAR